MCRTPLVFCLIREEWLLIMATVYIVPPFRPPNVCWTPGLLIKSLQKTLPTNVRFQNPSAQIREAARRHHFTCQMQSTNSPVVPLSASGTERRLDVPGYETRLAYEGGRDDATRTARRLRPAKLDCVNRLWGGRKGERRGGDGPRALRNGFLQLWVCCWVCDVLQTLSFFEELAFSGLILGLSLANSITMLV